MKEHVDRTACSASYPSVHVARRTAPYLCAGGDHRHRPEGLYDSSYNVLQMDDRKSPTILEFARKAVARSPRAPRNMTPVGVVTKTKVAHLSPDIDLMTTRK